MILVLLALSAVASADLNTDVSDAAARARSSTTCDSSALKERAVGGLEKAAVVQTYCAEISGRDCDSVIAKALRGDFVDLPYDCETMTTTPSKKKACTETLDKRLDTVYDQGKIDRASTPPLEPTAEQFKATADGIAQAHPGRKADVTLFKSEIDNYIRAMKGEKFDGHRSSFVLGEDIRQCLRADELLNTRMRRALDRLNARKAGADAAGGATR